MNASIYHILDEALTLSEDERSALMVTLLDSLQTDNPALIEQAWADEIRKRKADLQMGLTKAIPWEAATARISAL